MVSFLNEEWWRSLFSPWGQHFSRISSKIDISSSGFRTTIYILVKVQTFKNLAPDTKFESLEAQFFARPLRWDGIPNFGWNRVNYLQQQPVAFRRSCCCQVPANRESINPNESCFFQNALVHQLQKRVINTNFTFVFSLTKGISVVVS